MIEGEEYIFSMKDFEELGSIFNGRNPVKKYKHKISQKNVAIKSV